MNNSFRLAIVKAVILKEYGSSDVLQYVDIDKPTVAADQVLIQVCASSINPLDWKVRKGMLKVFSGSKFPLILGFDVAGIVAEIGSEVTQFKPGDAVFACTSAKFQGSANAEYITITESLLALKPANMSYEEAASVPLAALTALQALRDKGQVKAGDRILINGASGGVGCFAVQIAKELGAKVTGVCSTKNLQLVRSLGAETVLDYTQEDFTQNSVKYDCIFDAVAKQSFPKCRQVLKPKGIYISTLPDLGGAFWNVLTGLLPGKKAKWIVLNPNAEDLNILKNWIEEDKLRAIVDRTYPLSEVANAHQYSQSERAVGKIIITVSEP
ncbi:NAD(P)-dependent alcohol dehydrogenase [Spirulina sp. 06S082]|nr:NAD(P)-dependent alcohol dehydrogenase [Spirulina sp. 06S082]MEA5470196.1 NAD(P)-dependent alcohol dehydrogenase [Spirulina sp. 06S082]